MPRRRRDSEDYCEEDDVSDASENTSDREFEKQIRIDDSKEESEHSEVIDDFTLFSSTKNVFKHGIENIIAHRTVQVHNQILEEQKQQDENKGDSQDSNIDIQDILEENEKEKQKYDNEQIQEVTVDKGKIKIKKSNAATEKQQEKLVNAQNDLPLADQDSLRFIY